MFSKTAQIRGFLAPNAFASLRVAVALLILGASSVQLCAQGENGRILGAVTDSLGGNVAGAAITITDVRRGVPRTLTTDQDGEYVAPDLTPGIYTILVEAKGFKTF